VHAYSNYATAARALYLVAWQFYSNRWLNISNRPLSGGASEETSVPADVTAEQAMEALLISIAEIRVNEIGRQTRRFLDHYPEQGDLLLRQLGDTILKDDNGWNLLAALRTTFDEWALCADHPARPSLLVGLARWATDTRRRTGNVQAARTAQQFARGETAADLYE
tara:strand:- start:148 stop:645 length:498 start_codon:yes stop_codon:yes gene_type:complete